MSLDRFWFQVVYDLIADIETERGRGEHSFVSSKFLEEFINGCRDSYTVGST
jgi:hypothetical protein